jgi:hypothetical protein
MAGEFTSKRSFTPMKLLYFRRGECGAPALIMKYNLQLQYVAVFMLELWLYGHARCRKL